MLSTHRVFPREHSTHPSSEPNVSIGVRSSSGKRPSSLKDCFNELKRNSFSGIEGDGGRMVVRHKKLGLFGYRFRFPADRASASRSLFLIAAMVRLITHNLLACHVKGCNTNNFPLQFKDVQIELREAEFNPDFLKGFMPKLEWKALVDVAREVFISALCVHLG